MEGKFEHVSTSNNNMASEIFLTLGGHDPPALHVAMLLHGKIVVGHALVPTCLDASIILFWTPLPSSFICVSLVSGSYLVSQTVHDINIFNENKVLMDEFPYHKTKS